MSRRLTRFFFLFFFSSLHTSLLSLFFAKFFFFFGSDIYLLIYVPSKTSINAYKLFINNTLWTHQLQIPGL